MNKKITTPLLRPNFIPRSLVLLFAAVFSWLPANLAFAQSEGPVIRINAGTELEATDGGSTFIGDTYFAEASSVGPISGNSISGTTNDAIYQSERISNGSFDPFGYSIPVENGTYAITLHFAETAFGNSGQRVFDVEVEGVTVLDDFDIVAKVGPNTATQENIVNVPVNDGELNIDFISVIERAKISAIEVSGAVAQVTIPFALNAGGTAYTSTDYDWQEDDGTYFLEEGMAFGNSNEIENTTDDPLYQTERFHPTLRFVLPGIEKGIYTIELHFAETNHQSADQRVFDISIEGNTVKNDYDIFAEAGGFANAIIEEFDDVAILDGILNVTLTRSVGSATIHAIAITGARSVSNETAADELPDSHVLTSAYPNPFNPQTQFSLSVGTTQQVNIKVFNLLGQEVQTLYTGLMAAQQDRIFTFDAGTLPSGIYLIQVRGEQFIETQQVVLMK